MTVCRPCGSKSTNIYLLEFLNLFEKKIVYIRVLQLGAVSNVQYFNVAASTCWPTSKWSLVLHMVYDVRVSVRISAPKKPKTWKTLRSGPGGSLNSLDLFSYLKKVRSEKWESHLLQCATPFTSSSTKGTPDVIIYRDAYGGIATYGQKMSYDNFLF